jgi:phosphoglycolate phosphatase
LPALGPLLSDLDGTIADTAPVIFASLRHTCAELGIELTPEAELSWSLGPPLNYCLSRLGVADDIMGDAISIFERAHDDRIDMVVAMPGADDVIRELSETGVRIGVATIKPQLAAQRVIEHLGLSGCIEVVHGRVDDLDPRTKTDLLHLAFADLPGPHPLYVGDHDNDELAARELGIPFVRYPDHSWAQIRAAVLGLHEPGQVPHRASEQA